MSEQQSAYRQIMKATSIFGGVQIINIVISIIRTKFIAVFLGPLGLGILGLLNTTISLIGGLTNFGLGTSSVKDIAAAATTDDKLRIAIVVKVIRRLVWFTGILGVFIMFVFSRYLSQLTFGNLKYTLAFSWLSITLLISQLTSGQLVILQGMRKLQYLAKANIMGSITGLVISLPLYYIYGINGIVPAIIFTTLTSFILALYFGNRIKLEPTKVSIATTFAEGKSMLIMGFVISLNGLILIGTSYLVRIYISYKGGIEQVGLYSSGFTIINTYVGMIFTAMLTDYYPRLSAVAKDNKLCRQTINQQADIALLILAPILIIFLVFIKVVVILLLSGKFLATIDMINWAMLGIFFKAASWPIAFIFISKGDYKLFLINEGTASLYMLIFNILGYFYYGLLGLGISFIIAYLIYYLQVFSIAKAKYNFSYESTFYRIFLIQFGLAISSFITMKFIENPYNYLIGIVLIGYSTWCAYQELDRRLGIKIVLASIKVKLLKK